MTDDSLVDDDDPQSFLDTWQGDTAPWADVDDDQLYDQNAIEESFTTRSAELVDKDDTPADKVSKAHATELEQKNIFRPVLFWGLVATSAFGYLLTATQVTIYLIANPGSREVMISWMSVGVVQLLGMLYIIARYLFPNGRSDKG